MKILVVVYSRTGNTLSVARRIAEYLEANLEVIDDKTNRKGVLGFLRSGYEALMKRIPAIAEPKQDPGNYDLVIIGTPIWAGRMSSPIRAYLTRFKGRFKQVALFATSGTGGHVKAFEEMAEISGAKLVATIELTMEQLKRGGYWDSIKSFIEKVSS